MRLSKLEPRILFDGAALVELSQAVAHDDAAAAEAARTIQDHDSGVAIDAPVATTAPREIAFIDATLPDAQSLAQGLRAGVELVWLQPGADPWGQMSAALASRPGVETVHLLSHGSDATLNIGGVAYTTADLAARGATLAAWNQWLASDADILLYGCDLARDAAGEGFVRQLADLTGADVAASTNRSGATTYGADWNFEFNAGSIEAASCLAADAAQRYGATLAAFSLSGKDGWTAVMYGVGKDPDGDSQAGAADTDIIGDAGHGSLYVAYDDNGTPDNPNDDYMAFRMRIDNPTSSTVFSGVAIVGMDANQDGRIDLFFSVDGRNNTQAVRLLDPGTGANLSPNTTTTSPLPTGWLANNGVYPFAASNYAVSAVSAATDPNWGPSQLGGSGTAADLTGDGKTDVFISWKVPVADVAKVLAKPSPVDRGGVYGPRGATGIQGFTKDTVVAYVSFTQTQPGPINGDLNGVGASYDKNATFASLGVLTSPMSPANPVSAADAVRIAAPVDTNGLVNATEDNGMTVSGTAPANGWVRLTITDPGAAHTSVIWVQANGSGAWSVGSGDLSAFGEGTLSFDAALVGGNGSNSVVAGSVGDSTTAVHDSLPPTLAITPLATTGKPTISGTSTDVPVGSTLNVTIDPNGDGNLSDLVSYVVLVGAGGNWSLNTAVATPSSGSLSAAGLTAYAKITASGQDAAGNAASTVALDAPTVVSLSTTSATPTLSGTWGGVAGDQLTVTVDGHTYTAGDGRLSTSGTAWTLTIPGANAIGVGTYNVTATATRGGTSISDGSNGELVITAAPVINVGISSGTSGSNIWPTITGTSSTPNSYVILRLDPGNDGNLADAVTYSVATDGSGNWSLDTTSQPIAGQKPSGGYPGVNGVRVTDSSGAVSASQVLTITTPSVGITLITSTATTDSAAQNPTPGTALTSLNKTQDNLVKVSGTASGASLVDLRITDANGHVITVNGLAVSGGTWSATGLDLSTLDNGSLTFTATLSGTAVTATNTAVTHDVLPPRIFNTTPGEIKKNGGVITGGSELLNTQLTVTVRDSTDTSTVWSGNVTTDPAGKWIATTSGNLVGGATGTVIVKVQPTTTQTDPAGNITQQISWTQNVTANATTNTISIATIAGDNLITSGEIASGVTISGTTTLTGTPTINLAVSDGTTTINLVTSATTGAWSTSLTNAQVKTLLNGPLTVTATALDTGIAIQAVALPTLSLPSPVLTITDNTPGTATGAVTFTFSFSEGVSGFALGDISVSGGTAGTLTALDAQTYTLVVTPTAASSGNITLSVAASTSNGLTTGRGNIAASTVQPYDTTGAAAAPTLSIDTDNLAVDRTPLIAGTTSLAAGAPVLILVDTNNDGVIDLSYAATVQSGGGWSLDLGSATPTSGSLPADGVAPDAKFTAVATNAYGNSTSVIGHNKPAVTSQRTNDSTPTVSGVWTNVAGDVLSVQLNGTTYSQANGNLTVNGNAWSLTPSVALADATYNVTATVTRGGTGKDDVSSGEVIVDTGAPAVAIGAISNDSGASGSDFVTLDGTLVYSGTAESSAQVVVTLRDAANAVVFTAPLVATGGNWSVDRSALAGLADGSYRLTATATDAAGNSASATQDIVIDTQAAIGLTSGFKLTSLTPTLAGSTDIEAGRSLQVTISGATYTVTVQNGGLWELDLATATPSAGSLTPLADGQGYTVVVTGSDLAGNVASMSRDVQVDLAAPTISITGPLDWAGDANGTLTTAEDTAVVIKGTTTAPLGATLQISVTDGSTTISDTTTVQAGGNWQLAALNLRGMNNGRITVTATYVDDSGTPVSDVADVLHAKSGTLTIDSISNDTGITDDFVTRDRTLVFRGSATPGDTVQVSLAGNLLGSVTADAGGNWSFDHTATSLADGTYLLSINNGGAPVTRNVVVDGSAPSGPVSVNSQSTSDTTPVITGGATLGAGETLSVSLNGKTYTVGDGHLTYNAGSHTWSLQIPNADALTPASVASGFNGLYNVQATIRDVAGNVLDDVTSGELTVADTTAPVIDLAPSNGATLSRSVSSSNGAVVSLDNNGDAATLVEASDRLPSLRLTVSGLLDGTDEKLIFGATTLAADGSGGAQSGIAVGGVTVNIAYAAGVFTLQRADYAPLSAAEAQAIVRDIQYRNDAAAVSVGGRVFSFDTQDEAGNASAPAVATVLVNNGVVDTTAPAAPGLALVSASDSGSSNSDAKTNDSTPTLRVSLNGVGATAPVAGDIVNLYQGASLVGTAALDASDISAGYVDVTASVQGAGSLSFTAKITDVSNNTSGDSNAVAVLLDTAAPTLSTASVSGTTLTLSYAEAGSGFDTTTPAAADFALTKNGGTSVAVSSVSVDTTLKTVTLTLASAITNADANILLDYTPGGNPVEDVAGNAAAGFSNQAITNASPDTTAPAAPTLALVSASDSGSSNSDAKTKDTTPTLRVTLNGSGATAPVAGDVVDVYQGATLVGTATLQAGDVAAGYVDVTSGAQAAGSLGFTARITDAANNTSADSNSVAVLLDTTAPALTTASVSGTTLTLSYAEAGSGFDGTTPAAADFALTKNGGSNVGISGVSVDTTLKTVTLTLAAPITNADANVLLSYTPGANALRDVAGNAASGFGGQAVANASGDTTPPAAPTLSLLPSSDTGSSPSDGKTNDATPTLRVTLTGSGPGAPVAGDVVRLYQGATLVGTATLQAGDISAGYVDVTSGAQAAGSLGFTANITDAANNTGADSNPVAVLLDTTAPTLSTASVSGTTLTLSYAEAGSGFDGTTPAAADFVLTKNGGSSVGISSVSVDTTLKTVTLTLASAITNADANVLLSYTPGANALRDVAGNAASGFSGQAVVNASGDTTAPAAPSLALVAASDSGSSNSDAKTSDSTPTLRVTFNGSGATAPVAGDVVKLYQGATLVGTATLQASDIAAGYVDVTASAQSAGGLSFTARITDAANNTGSDSNAVAVLLDTTAPALTTASVSGTTLTLSYAEAGSGFDTTAPVAADFVLTKNGGSSVGISGVSVDTTLKTVTLTLASAITNADSNILLSYAPGGSPVEDVAGNAAAGFSNQAITNASPDTTAPAAPTLALVSASDSGSSSSDAKTNDSTPTLRVTLNGSGASAPVAGDVVRLYQGATLVGTATLQAGDVAAGYVDVTASAQSAGGLSFTARITDAANNTGSDSNAVAVLLDTTAPALTTASVSGTTLTLSYAEAGSGFDTSTPAAADFALTRNGGTSVAVSSVSVDTTLKTVTLTLAAPITNADSSILLSYTPGANALQDVAGNAAAGFSNQAIANASPDTTAPAAPSLALLSASDSGSSSSDAKTNDSTPTLRVTLNGSGATAPVAGDVVRLYQGGVLVGTVTLSAGDIAAGHVDVTSAAQAGGALNFTARITDAANNVSGDSNPVAVDLDLQGPAVQIAGVPALHNGVDAFSMDIVFDEPVGGLTASGLDVVGGSLSGLVQVDAQTYRATLAPSGAARVSLSVLAGAAQDAAGNGSAAAGPRHVDAVVTPTVPPQPPVPIVVPVAASAPATQAVVLAPAVPAPVAALPAMASGSAGNDSYVLPAVGEVRQELNLAGGAAPTLEIRSVTLLAAQTRDPSLYVLPAVGRVAQEASDALRGIGERNERPILNDNLFGATLPPILQPVLPANEAAPAPQLPADVPPAAPELERLPGAPADPLAEPPAPPPADAPARDAATPARTSFSEQLRRQAGKRNLAAATAAPRT